MARPHARLLPASLVTGATPVPCGNVSSEVHGSVVTRTSGDEAQHAPASRAGPGSVAWRVNGERAAVLGWGRAILLQLAHPLVAEGVGAHSGFRGSPYATAARFHATVRAMLALTFGTEDEARSAVARIRRVHDGVRGTLGSPTARRAAGTPYSAHDPMLLAWVNLTLLDSVPLAYSRFVSPLTDDDVGRYVRESRWSAERIGARPGDLPLSAADARGDMDRWLHGDELEVTDTARRLARAVVHPSLGWLAGPVARLHALSAIGWLPEALRDAYGFRFTTGDAGDLEAWCERLRSWSRRAPAHLRRWGVARRAERAAVAGAPDR